MQTIIITLNNGKKEEYVKGIKVKEILNIDKSEFEFYEELSIGIKLYMIYQNMMNYHIKCNT